MLKPHRWNRRHASRLETLEDRTMLSAGANIDANLSAMIRAYASESTRYLDGYLNGVDQSNEVAQNAFVNALEPSGSSLFTFDDAGRVLVSLWSKTPDDSFWTQWNLDPTSIVAVNGRYGLVDAYVDIFGLESLAAMPGTQAITPVYRPILRAGSVETQGDAVLNADDVRSAGYDGTDVLVGVLSDSALNIDRSQATGDLPSLIHRYLEFPASDEGRAMMEIIHDIAPGAGLAHHSAILSESSFADGIRTLAAAGAKVIVDDVGYYTEPFFQDGIIAQAVNEVIAAGVTYISAAGNDANRSYEAVFEDADPGSASDFQDFDPGAGIDTRQQITIPAGYTTTLVFQWDDPFYTSQGVTHDFNVRIYDTSDELVPISGGSTNNIATQQPIEILQWTSTGTGVYQVEIERVSGSGSSQLKYVLSTNSEAGTIDEFATDSGTIVGHPAVAGAIAVGAVPFYAPDSIEPFSSQGNVTHYFDAAGNRLTVPELRYKPDVVAPDNVNTSFFGSDIPQDSDDDRNFAGTSAAAPHVAGVAAQLLDANPHLTRAEVYNVLTSTAVDLGATGFDEVYGYGRVDAFAALTAAQSTLDITSPTAVLRSPISVHGWTTSKIVVQFNEPMEQTAAQSAASYTLLEAGSDQVFGTSDDVSWSFNASLDALFQEVTLTPTAPGTELPLGHYRLTLDATGALADPAGNPLNQGTDAVFDFEIAPQSLQTNHALPFAGSVPQLAVRSDGTTFIVYPVDVGYLSHIRGGRFDEGGRIQSALEIIQSGISFRFENADVAVHNTGGVVVYSDYQTIVYGDPDEFKIDLQIIDENGRSVGARQTVSWIEANSDRRPRVAMNASGDFVVAYPNRYWNGTSYDGQVRAKRYSSDGTPIGNEIIVVPAGNTETPSVAIADDGTMVFVWKDSDRIQLKRYDASGNALGPATTIAVIEGYVSNGETKPEIAMAADGSFAVAWKDSGIWIQRFNASGQFIDGPQKYGGRLSNSHQVSRSENGRIAIVWGEPDGDGNGAFVQRIQTDGTPFGSPLAISEFPMGEQSSPTVEFRDDNSFVVAWSSRDAASGTRTGHTRWYSWNADETTLPYGPRISSLTPETPIEAAFTTVSFTFDREIEFSSLTTADLLLTDPAGRTITIDSVNTTDNRTFSVSFIEQSLVGEYRLTIGPNVVDLNGLAMDSSGDAINGDSSDSFIATYTRDWTDTANIPYQGGFEVSTIDDVSGEWSFSATDGSVSVISSSGPHSGSGHLSLIGPTGSGFSYRAATLRVDLTGQSAATDLGFDFWAKRAPGITSTTTFFQLSVSQDGVTWFEVGSSQVGSPDTYIHYGYDLDQALLDADIPADGIVLLRINQQSYYSGHGFQFDDFRVGNRDVLGPQVIAQTPEQLVPAPLESFQLQFNEPINPSTFTASDVTFLDPTNTPIALSGDPVDSGDQRTFTVNLASPQYLSGTYTLTIGTDVTDMSGNKLNQDQNQTNGDPDDSYESVIQVGGLTGATLPYFQDFEGGTFASLAQNWSFLTNGGSIDIQATNSPLDSRHLVMTHGSGNVWNTREATLLLDLSGHVSATDLTLDFWLQRTVNRNGTEADVVQLFGSDDGITFVPLTSTLNPGLTGVYTHYTFDLDQLLIDKGIAFDADVSIKFVHNAYYSGSEYTLDDIRIGSFDASGPHVTFFTPDTVQTAPIETFGVTFNEPINPATFLQDSVFIRRPDGRTIELVADPVPDASNTTFTLTLENEESLSGEYRIILSSQIEDTFGNHLDQNQDGINGHPDSSDDALFIVRREQPAVATVPYYQDFEAGILEDLGAWSFATDEGAISLTSTGNPHSGSQQLLFTKGKTSGAWNTRYATLKIDLSTVTSATDLTLSFFLKKLYGFNRTAYFDLYGSNDGQSYTRLAAEIRMTDESNYLHYQFDLDQRLSNAGLSTTGVVYLRFDDRQYYADQLMALEDVRITQGDGTGPRVVSATPAGTIVTAVNSATVTFSEPVDVTSFTPDNIRVINPAGTPILLMWPPVDSGDQQTFTLNFVESFSMVGTYAVEVGPSVRDLSGNEMNQNEDDILGRTNGSDTYRGEFDVSLPLTAIAPPLVDSFEVDSTADLTGWSFDYTSGYVEVTGSLGPYAGTSQLNFVHPDFVSATRKRNATLLLDLSAWELRTDVTLDFWTREPSSHSSHTMKVFLSGDGNNWHATSLNAVPSGYQYNHFVYDLDQELGNRGITVDGDVYIRFEHSAYYGGSTMQLDHVRVRSGSLNRAPTFTNVSYLGNGTEDQAFAFTFDDLVAKANESDSDSDPLSFRVESVLSGSLLVNGNPVVPGTTLIATGDSVTWTPPENVNGILVDTFTIRAWDGDLVSGSSVIVPVRLNAVNDAAEVSLENTLLMLPENEDTSNRIKVADIVVSDVDSGTNTLSLSGPDSSLFEIVGFELFLRAATVLDFESNPALEVSVDVNDNGIPGTPDNTVAYLLAITDVNEAPTAVALTGTPLSVNEDLDTSSRVKVADIVVSDDALGTNTLSLSGADVALFEIIGTELFIKADSVLNGTTNPVLEVIVSVDDDTVGSVPDASFSLNINVSATPPTVAITRVGNQVGNGDIVFDLTFSEDVVNVDLTDFVVVRTGTLNVAGAVICNAGDADDSTYTLTFTGVTGKGTLGLDVSATTNIVDNSSNPLDQTPTTDDNFSNDASGAILLPPGGTVNGNIATNAERDSYTFEVVAGPTYLFQTSLGTLTSTYLRLENVSGNFIADSTGSPTSRIEYTSTFTGTLNLFVEDLGLDGTGTYTVSAPTVSYVDSALSVYGTTANDAVTVRVNGRYTNVAVNGVSDTYFQLTNVDVYGNGGSDRFALYGGSGDSSSTMGMHSTTTTIGGSLVINSFSTETNYLYAQGGNDSVSMFDTIGSDTLTATSTYTLLSGPGVRNWAFNYPTVNAYSNTVGSASDTAYIYDSPADDTFTATPTLSKLTGGGISIRAEGFNRVQAYASAGGNDTASLQDSAGNDSFVANPTFGILSGPGFYNQTASFETVIAYRSTGNDTATLLDSAGNDQLVARPDYTQLSGTGFRNRAVGFQRVGAYSNASASDSDHGTFIDSAGNDTFSSTPVYATMTYANGVSNFGSGFNVIDAYSSAGADQASLFDATSDDTLNGYVNRVTLSGPGVNLRANAFSHVSAYATAGGNDRANLFDSITNDTFVSSSTNAILIYNDGPSPTAKNYVQAFERVHAYATSGTDSAYFKDSPGDDTFVFSPTTGSMVGGGVTNFTQGFDRHHGYSNAGGSDQLTLNTSTGTNNFVGNIGLAQLSGSGYYNTGSNFESVIVNGTTGSNNIRKLTNPNFILQFFGEWING